MVKLQHYETLDLEDATRADSDIESPEPPFKIHPRWYLVQCKAREDNRALEHLERQGFECYHPLYEKERIRRGRQELARVALFPGYLFIRLDCIHDNWLPIRSTRGVIQIVRFNDFPLAVADGIVDEIRRRIAGQPIREPYLASGERVVIADGGFAGIEAIFVASDGDERVMLLLNIMQTDQTLSFPIESVRKLERKVGMG